MTPPGYDSDLRFKASLEDDVSPKVDKLVEQLKKAGASPAEIKMFLRAYDEATPKIKEARRQADALPKGHIIKVQADTDQANKHIDELQRRLKQQPIQMDVDSFKETNSQLKDMADNLDKLFSFRGTLGGGSSMIRGLGAGALGIGAITAVGGAVQQGIQVNSEREQSMVTLTQTLKDNTQAQQEMGKLVNIAQKTPFNYADVLQGDVRLRSYQIPSMPGEGGPQNKGWLNAAGDMAAAMNTPITQAVEAIADARQGYFVRMMSYGIRMMREDFQAGGKYAGMTYEQGLEKALHRFEGAQAMQSKTFQGVMSNLQDILQNQILKPLGQGPFEVARSTAKSLQDRLQQPGTQLEIGQQMERVQHGFFDMYEMIKRGKEYFQDYILQPLKDIVASVSNVAGVFVKQFGGTLLTVFKTVGEVILGISKPLSEFVAQHEGLVKTFATFKALSLLGFGGPAKGLKDIGGAMSPLHPSISRLVGGFRELIGGSIKVGLALIVKGFTDAKVASDELHSSLNKLNVKGDDAFDQMHAKVARLAGGLHISSTNLSKLAAQAMTGIKVPIEYQNPDGKPASFMGISPAGINLANTGLRMASDAQAMHRDYGINASDAVRLMNEANVTTQQGADKAAQGLVDLKTTADDLNMSFKDAVRVMHMFSTQATPVGLGGIKGSPYLAALSKGASSPGFLNPGNVAAGITTGDDMLRQMLSSTKSPSIDMLRRASSQGPLTNFFHLTGNTNTTGSRGPQGLPGGGNKSTQTLWDNLETDQANKLGFKRDQAYVNRVTGGNIQLPNMLDPKALAQDFNPSKITNLDNTTQQAEALYKAWDKNQKALDGVNDRITKINESINSLNSHINDLNLASSRLSIKMMEMQRSFVPLQRQIEDAQYTVQAYTQKTLRPLEEQMTRLGQVSTDMGNKMSEAQYQMAKFSGGLMEGEQAALNQLHAMERYNRGLQMMQLQYEQIGDQLGQTQYDQGARLRVEPLANITLAAQTEKLQRRQQLAQLKYDDSYGEQHYQLQQAARTRNERTEMPFSERMKGVTAQAGIIDQTTRAQHALGQETQDVQKKAFEASQHIQAMNDSIADLSLKLQDRQLHGGLRELQDQEYHLSHKSAELNLQLSQQNVMLNTVQTSAIKLRDQGQALSDWWQSLLDFDHDKPGVLAKRMLQFQRAAGMLSPKQFNTMMDWVNTADRNVNRKTGPNSKEEWVNTIHQGVASAISGRTALGVITGETERNINAQIRPHAGPLKPFTGTAATIGETLLAVGGIAAVASALIPHLAKQAFIRTPLHAVAHFIKPDLGKNTAARILRAQRRIRRGRYLRRIPGIKSFAKSPLEGLSRVAEGGMGKEFARIMGGGGFFEGIKESFKLITRFRTLLGGAAGSMLGAAVSGGDPIIAMLGGMLGSRAGRDNSITSIYRRFRPKPTRPEFGDILGEDGKVLRTAGSQRRAAQARRIRNLFRWNAPARRPGRIRQIMRGAGKLRGKAADALRRFHGGQSGEVSLEGVGKVIDKLHGVADKFHSAAGAFGDSAKTAGSHLGGALRTFGEKLPVISKILGVGGTFHQLLQGNVKGAADFASYFIPVVGEARTLFDVIDTLGGHPGRPNPIWTAAGNQDYKGNADQIVRRAYSPDRYAADAAGDIGASAATARQNLSPAEQEWLKSHRDRMFALAKETEARAKQGKDVKDNLDKLSQLESDYSRGYKNFTKDRIDRVSEMEDGYNQSSLLSTLKSMSDKHDATDSGFKAIHNTTDTWLDKIDKRIKRFKHSLEISDSPSGADAPDISNATNDANVLAAHPYKANGGGFAFGGKTIKGKGDGKGRLYWAGEEDDELIIPLAPHRRDRAKSLVKQAAGIVGASYHANGGLVIAGDSLGVGTSPYLPDKAVDAVVGRSSASGVDALKALLKKKPSEILLDLGTNDATASQLAASLSKADRMSGNTPIFVPTVHGPAAASKNALINHFGGDIHAVDWSAPLGPDGIHPTAEGYKQRAAQIEKALSQGEQYVRDSNTNKTFAGPGLSSEGFAEIQLRGFANGGDPAYHVAKSVYQRAAAAVPALANGGYPAGPWGTAPGLGVLSKFVQSKFGLPTTAGRTNHNKYVAGTNRISDHFYGRAIDVSDGIDTPNEATFYKFATSKMKDMVGQVIHDHSAINTGGAAWRYTPNDHFNHVHISLLDKYANNPALTDKILMKLGDSQSVKGLISQVAGTAAESTGPQWPKTPEQLLKMGAIGKALYHSLRMLRKNNSGKSGAAGGTITGGGNSIENQRLGKKMAAAMGWTGGQWSALQKLWTGESHWQTTADNPTSTAYGIPQGLEGSTHPELNSSGPYKDYHTNPATQIKWGLNYIKSSYGSPSNAYNKWLSRSPHWYAQGKDKVQNPAEVAILHQGERVLNAAQATAADKDSDPKEQRRRDVLASNIAEIVDNMRSLVRHMRSVDDKTEKKAEKKDLSILNAELRKKWGQLDSPAAQNKEIAKAVSKAGDTSGGEDTLALVRGETHKAHHKAQQAVQHYTHSKAGRGDAKRVHRAATVRRRTIRGAQSAHSAGGKRITKKELHAIKATTHARNSARKVVHVAKSAARHRGQGRYLLSAAKRGVNSKVARQAIGRRLTKKEAVTYHKAVTKKPGSKAQDHALAQLSKVIKQENSKNTKEVSKARTQARQDAKSAQKAIHAAGLDQIKHHTKTAAVAHKAAVDIRDHVRVGTLKGVQATEHVHTETKEGTKTAKRSEAKKDKADSAQDKRERDHFKKMEDFMEALVKKDWNVAVHNSAKGAELSTTIIKAKRAGAR